MALNSYNIPYFTMFYKPNRYCSHSHEYIIKIYRYLQKKNTYFNAIPINLCYNWYDTLNHRFKVIKQRRKTHEPVRNIERKLRTVR